MIRFKIGLSLCLLPLLFMACNNNSLPQLPPLTEEQPASVESESASPQTVTEAPVTNHPEEALVTSFPQPSQTTGEVLILYGQVVDVANQPIPDAIIEIWQTDLNGVYDHPRDPGTSNRDTTFQFFGQTSTDEAGWYAFRTIMPGRYEPRPRHIHFKVKQGENTELTSQFYFSDDVAEVQQEGMFQAVGNDGDLLLLQLVQGDGHLLARGQIVIDTGIGSGTLPLTPAQGEGPYYPVTSFEGYDNDLVRLSSD